MRIGVIGCGSISSIYFQNLARFEGTEVVACADLDVDRARAAASQHCVPRASSPEELIADPDIELVLNLTVPKAHFEISFAAIEAGKHVYVEKPLAAERAEGIELLRSAEMHDVRVGCAPDTVLGAGIQTCRSLVDSGTIGVPVGANAFMLCPGHESWHPSPEFYYERGGGPMFDMGPYYVATLFALLGPAAHVHASARPTFETRVISSAPKSGWAIRVETPTHVVGTIEYESGAIAHLSTSFDVQGTTLPPIELYGSEGTLLVPDPNGFGGPVRLYRKDTRAWEEVPLTHPHSQESRGLGVLDMVEAIRDRRPHRASGAMGLHALDMFHAFLESAEAGHRIGLLSGPARSDPMPSKSE